MTNQMTNAHSNLSISDEKSVKLPENYSFEAVGEPSLVTMGQYGPQVFKMLEKRCK